MIADHQMVSAILDETIAALTGFDYARLEMLEERMGAMSTTNLDWNAAGISEVQQRSRLLESLLLNCGANLNTLKRLYARNRMEPWVR